MVNYGTIQDFHYSGDDIVKNQYQDNESQPLFIAYPNPFNPETNITFTVIKEEAYVNIEIFNILGRKVVTLLDQKIANGEHTIKWNGRNSQGEKVSAGIYICNFKISGDNKAVKITLMP